MVEMYTLCFKLNQQLVTLTSNVNEMRIHDCSSSQIFCKISREGS